ncbi:hypothetical protein Tco_0811820 [Tanacetum coccineum]
MYKVVTTQESQTNEAKSDLSSIGMNAASSVRRPMNRDLHVKNSVLASSKNSAKKAAVYVRKNKQTDNTFANVILHKENVNDVNVANAAKAKTLLCVSCMQNVLIPCHDKCLAKILNSNVLANCSCPDLFCVDLLTVGVSKHMTVIDHAEKYQLRISLSNR